jgi:hypothetical protein
MNIRSAIPTTSTTTTVPPPPPKPDPNSASVNEAASRAPAAELVDHKRYGDANEHPEGEAVDLGTADDELLATVLVDNNNGRPGLAVLI